MKRVIDARFVRRLGLWVLVALGMAAPVLPAGAATYYVATGGSDSNPGTQAAPFLTLQQAANTAVAGDTVIVQDGTYGPGTAVTGGDSDPNNYSPVVLYNSGTPSAWITFQAAHKWAAVLDCQMTCDSYINLLNASYIVIQDFVITHGYKEGIHSNDAAHYITLRGNRIESIAQRYSTYPYGMNGMFTSPNCHDFVIDGNEFHDIGRSNWTGLDHGLYLHGSNFTITNNIFYNIVDGWSIQVADGMSTVLIANNTFAGADGGGKGQIMLWNTQSNLTIENNIFYNPQDVAIVRYNSTVNSCFIDHNLVYGAAGVIGDPTGCSVGGSLVGINPLFVNVSADDFRVQAGGPGINAGVYLGAVPVDFEGVTRPPGSTTDIGAYQSVAPAAAPVISAVFAAADGQPGIVSGALISIQGSNFTTVAQDDWSHAIGANGLLPTQLDGVSATIGGKPAAIYAISPNQINVQAPDLSPGNVAVTVTNTNGTSASFTATAQPYGPAFFLWPGNQPVTTHADFSIAAKNGTFATPTVPAHSGETAILWGTGFGPTTSSVPAGVVPDANLHLLGSLSATVNGISVPASGALSSYPSVYQINITIPASLANGDYPVVVSVNGVSSPTVMLTVQ